MKQNMSETIPLHGANIATAVPMKQSEVCCHLVMSDSEPTLSMTFILTKWNSEAVQQHLKILSYAEMFH